MLHFGDIAGGVLACCAIMGAAVDPSRPFIYPQN
jgi:hypothetical protein